MAHRKLTFQKSTPCQDRLLNQQTENPEIWHFRKPPLQFEIAIVLLFVQVITQVLKMGYIFIPPSLSSYDLSSHSHL